MIIENNTVTVKWSGNNKEHYISMGYIFSKYGDLFDVLIKDLVPTSGLMVEFICDVCKGEKQITQESKFRKYVKLNASYKKIGKHVCCNCKGLVISGTRLSHLPKKSLESVFPEVYKIWSDKNIISPKEISYGSTKKYWFKCILNKDHPEYLCDIQYKSKTKRIECPCCAGRSVTNVNSLGYLHPELVEQWDYDKNKATPFDYTRGSKKRVYWKCLNGHSWEESIEARTGYKKLGCPYCSGHRLVPENSLGAVFPKISKEWHPTKNNGKTPYDYSQKSDFKAWWKCHKCGNEWQAGICNRTLLGRGCKVCAQNGFTEDTPASLYLVEWYNENYRFLKFGITKNDIHYRANTQKLKCDSSFKYKILYDFHFTDGSRSMVLETLLKNTFKCGVVDKNIFGDGYSETTSLENLDAILQVINEFNAQEETVNGI